MKKIKHYKIIEQIGSGGMGEVFKAFDTVLERYVAIKVMHRHLLKDVQNDERFMREARIVAKSTHANIVTIFEIGKTKLERFIVMEFVEGEPLNGMLKKTGAFEPERAVNLTLQILSGLQHAHKLNILHRDIKAENILVTSDDHIKILDFGIAKIATKEGLTVAGDLLGTVEYMAPEQLMGEPVDARGDLYSTGVVLYQMLTGTLPFVSDSPAAILYKQLNEDAVPPSHYNSNVDSRLDGIVLKVLNKDKNDRWESAEQFAQSLQDWLAGKNHRTTGVALDGPMAGQLAVKESEDDSREIFIGREEEMNILIRAFGKALSGQGQTISIMGEAGVGKSTLADRFRKYANLNKAFVLYGASLYQEGMDAYLPFIDALRTFFSNEGHRLPLEKRSEVKDIVREKTPLLMELTERFTTHFGEKKDVSQGMGSEFNLVEGIYALVSVLSTIHPVVLIIDDLQWADEASLRLFHYLSRYIRDDRVCLIGISRTDKYDLRQNGKPGKLLEVLARIKRDSNYTQIRLNRLQRESCDLLIDRLLSPNLFSEEFYKAIFSETKGNPLFVTETLKQLEQNDCIYLKDEIWYNIQEGLDVVVPDRVEDIFVRRLSSLSEDEHEILQVAAVQGYKFDASILSKVLEISKIKILKACQHIEREYEIIASTEQGFHFEHPLLKDLLYNEIPRALRREYHLMIAEEIEKTYAGELGSMVGDVAQHYRHGGDHRKAIPLLFQAGMRAFELSAFREASIYLEDMLDSVKQTGEAIPATIPQTELYFKLGICYEEGSRFEESLKAYQVYLDISKQQHDISSESNALLRLGRVQGKLGNWDAALANYEACLKIGKENALKNLLSRVYNNVGLIHFHQGDYQKAIEYFEMSMQVVDSEYGEFDKANALTNIGIIANINNQHEKAMEHYQDALEIYKAKGGRKQDEARIHHNIGMTYSDLGEWQSAIDAFEACLKIADDVEDRQLVGLTYLNMGKTYVRQNNLPKARGLSEKALKIFKRTDDMHNVAETYQVLGLVAEAEGNWAVAEKNFLHSLRLNEELGAREGLAEGYFFLAKLYQHQGKYESAMENYNHALKEYQSLELTCKMEEVAKCLDDLELNRETPIKIVEVEAEPKPKGKNDTATIKQI